MTHHRGDRQSTQVTLEFAEETAVSKERNFV